MYRLHVAMRCGLSALVLCPKQGFATFPIDNIYVNHSGFFQSSEKAVLFWSDSAEALPMLAKEIERLMRKRGPKFNGFDACSPTSNAERLCQV